MKQQAFDCSLFQVAEIELTYYSSLDSSKRPVISSSSAAYDFLSSFWNNPDQMDRQQFSILLLNRANRALGIFSLPVADLIKMENYQRKVFTQCLKANTVAIIASHYLPCHTDCSPICEEAIATALKTAGSLLDIAVLDCIISNGKGYSSLADQGLL